VGLSDITEEGWELVNVDAVVLVVVPNANLGVNPPARSVLCFGGQRIARRRPAVPERAEEELKR
jgi:hypothetical protein